MIFNCTKFYLNVWISFQRGTPNFDQAYYDAFRRKMEQDRQRAQAYAQHAMFHQGPSGLFASVSVILIVMALGFFLHALQYR